MAASKYGGFLEDENAQELVMMCNLLNKVKISDLFRGKSYVYELYF